MSSTAVYPNGYVLLPDGSRESLPEPADPEGGFTLEQLQAAVGGYIEQVYPQMNLSSPRVPRARLRAAWERMEELIGVAGGLEFLVDEEGLLKGLEVNSTAACLLTQTIVGPLVVLPGGLLR
jgi:hypothetical protein